MDKPAITNKTIHPIIKKRWSPRSFEDRAIEKDKLQRIFDAGRWAPSSFNEQPWRFMLGLKGGQTWDKIYESLVDFNQQWAKLAPLLVLTIGKKTSSRNNAENRVFQYDVGQSVAYITFQAYEEGLVMHQMSGFSKEKAAELFEIPEDYEPLTVFAMGYQGEPERLDGDFVSMEKAPRQRKELPELVFSENFGKSSDRVID